MGIFGAIFAGVSGLNSQSDRIGIISNNIANANTVGFKEDSASFDTLVVPSGTTTFSPGGVIGNTQALINEQGLVQATDSSTDVAITGAGFFMVNSAADSSGNSYLTRAGSFTQDSQGNFVNANGYYLQGVPVTTPPTPLNAGNLRTVNINSSATGAATPTSTITIASNFDASQSILTGAGETVSLAADTTNVNNTAGEIIAPTTGALGNNLTRGDKMVITSQNAGDAFTLTYGGFTIGRSITATVGSSAAAEASNEGDGGSTTLLDSESVVASDISNNSTSTANGTITVIVTNPSLYSATAGAPGNSITIAGSSDVNGIPAADINGTHQVLSVNTTTGAVTFAASNSATGTSGSSGDSTSAITVNNRTYSFTGNILNATVPGGDFLPSINTSTTFTSNALQFSIATTSDGTFTFTYNEAALATSGQFNNLDTLVDAINGSSDGKLTASVVNNQLYVSATDPSQGLTFTNGDATGAGGLNGINWVQELGLPTTQITNVNAAAPTGVNRFNSLSSLENVINANDSGHNLVASVSSLTSTSPTLSINETDPQSAITFADYSGNTGGSILKALGFSGPSGTALTSTGSNTNTTTFPKVYSAGSASTDMSSGAVTPQYTKDITVFDSLGNAHNLAMNVVKIGVNTWAVELTLPADSLAPTTSGTNDGQIASGIVKFNGDGTLESISAENGVTNDSIASPVVINWSQSGPTAVGAAQSTISVNLQQLIQSSGAFSTTTATQNGSSVGELTGVTINSSGFVVASFSNGQTQEIYQVPLANVNNPDGLDSVSGDAYEQTLDSGQVNLDAAGTNGTGTLTSSALEQSNVDISTQLTDLIVAQQAYGANSKVLTIADQLLQELDQIIQ